MNLNDLKENLSQELRNRWDQIQDTSIYNQIKDRYENLTPLAQKGVLFGGLLLILMMILSGPYSSYTTSSEFVATYEEKRQLIRDLLKTSRETQDVPQIPVPPPAENVRTRIESDLQNARLIPSQIKGVEVVPAQAGLIPANMIQGLVQVTLEKLNLRQVVDLGYQFQAINPSVKVKDLSMTANAEDGRYYDVIYKLVVLNIPERVETPAEEAPARPARGRGNR